MAPHRLSHQQFERSFGSFELIALVLSILQRMDQLVYLGVVLWKLDAVSFYLVQKTASASVVRDQHALSIPNSGWVDMFIGRRVLQDSLNLNTSLVGKSRVTDIGLMFVRHQIRYLRDKARHILQVAQSIGQGWTLH